MAKRTFIKFYGKCQVKKVIIRGKSPVVTMKCPKSVIKKIKSAQSYINEA